MQNGYAVVLEDVTKRYGDGPQAVPALAGVTVRVARGEFLAVVGPSGSGKSTLLNLIAALDAPTSGRVVVAGHDLTSLTEDARSDLRLRAIGFVFQAFNLFPTFDAIENVAWPLEFQGTHRRAARARAADLLARLGLPPRAWNRRPAELSGGEQQRVAIARALVGEPRLLVADEPTGNLDSATGDEILALLREVNARQRTTVVLVTHSPTAAAHADRTIELRDGKIIHDTRKT
jgi:putative ABC transport system ATP-binding protein